LPVGHRRIFQVFAGHGEAIICLSEKVNR
jgi:hypothetical protein